MFDVGLRSQIRKRPRLSTLPPAHGLKFGIPLILSLGSSPTTSSIELVSKNTSNFYGRRLGSVITNTAVHCKITTNRNSLRNSSSPNRTTRAVGWNSQNRQRLASFTLVFGSLSILLRQVGSFSFFFKCFNALSLHSIFHSSVAHTYVQSLIT